MVLIHRVLNRAPHWVALGRDDPRHRIVRFAIFVQELPPEYPRGPLGIIVPPQLRRVQIAQIVTLCAG